MEDSLCVPQYNRDGAERVVLFLKMASGHSFRPDLVKRIRDAIRLGLSARHVPSVILETRGIPVRRALCGWGLCSESPLSMSTLLSDAAVTSPSTGAGCGPGCRATCLT